MIQSLLSARLHRFNAYSSKQKRAFLIAIFAMPVVRVGLRYWGFVRLTNWITKGQALKARAILTTLQVGDLGQAVNAAARHGLVSATCLPRSLCLLWLLRRQGILAVLRIGVQFGAETGEFTAHAWIEYEGVPVNDKMDIASDYAVFNEDVPLRAFKTR